MSDLIKIIDAKGDEATIIAFLKRLYDPNGKRYRRSGRTTIMAKAFILIAFDNPKTKIRFHDHYPGREGMMSMKRTLRQICHGMPQYEVWEEFIVYRPDKRVDIDIGRAWRISTEQK